MDRIEYELAKSGNTEAAQWRMVAQGNFERLQAMAAENKELKAERGRLLVVLELAEHVVSDVQVSDYKGLLFITQRHIDDLRKAIEEAALAEPEKED